MLHTKTSTSFILWDLLWFLGDETEWKLSLLFLYPAIIINLTTSKAILNPYVQLWINRHHLRTHSSISALKAPLSSQTITLCFGCRSRSIWDRAYERACLPWNMSGLWGRLRASSSMLWVSSDTVVFFFSARDGNWAMCHLPIPYTLYYLTICYSDVYHLVQPSVQIWCCLGLQDQADHPQKPPMTECPWHR